mmetsp:Transcript_29118/g.40029  ORF Transcript_29118/g.40029 Transcript_29118/m.40029 type:complete len:87 (-) Transcript_29118:104-364(-)
MRLFSIIKLSKSHKSRSTHNKKSSQSSRVSLHYRYAQNSGFDEEEEVKHVENDDVIAYKGYMMRTLLLNTLFAKYPFSFVGVESGG